jgi:hypothetical protein
MCIDMCLQEVKGLPSRVGVSWSWGSDDARAAESATSRCNTAIRARCHLMMSLTSTAA